LFPNNFHIYLHDTPAKSLFSQQKRAFSHGCIRIEDPQRMAEWVLRDQPQWTTEHILQAMNGSEEKYVTIDRNIPVVIGYFTAWVSANGSLNFREDVYGHDARLAQRLFER
jgi:murein L,D-transpeptidase YcbB/YkuD